MFFDVVVIGGGVVGTACFNKLVRLGVNCALLEKENDVGFGPSKANSGLIHSGFDCIPNTLKAKLNMRGSRIFEKVAERLKVPYIKNGHIVVGNDINKIKDLLERGHKNGVKDLRILESKELHQMEPNLIPSIKYGLYAPTGAMISSYELAIAYAEEGIINGGKVYRSFNTVAITKKDGAFEIKSDDNRTIICTSVINACGAGFNDIAKLLGTEIYEFEFRRGEYYLLDSCCSNFVNHTIFPLPSEKSKGILVTPTTFGNILVGPTSYPSTKEPITTEDGLRSIKESVSQMFLNVPFQNTIRVFAGVRTIVGNDFVIEKSKLDKNVINVAGICSPGLSASPAIADYVAEILGYDPLKEKDHLRERDGVVPFRLLSKTQKNKLIKENPDFGRVVCRCENITLGEVKQALNSPFPAASVDGIKRRTRAGMGRCQGGFCIFSVLEQLSKSYGCPMEDIDKDAEGSEILRACIKNSIRREK